LIQSNSKQENKRPWLLSFIWLAVLVPIFFGSYNFANSYTATRSDVGSLVFSWEYKIPFIPWTIIPYWSIDLLYPISLFICVSRKELNIHALRILTFTVLSVIGFLLWPLRFTFDRPVTDGFFGELFTLLFSFDLPYNQAPSMHIALLWILWMRFRIHLKGILLLLLNIWCLLIGISVLTTYQHHFIDVITGFFLGVAVTYFIPDIGIKWLRWNLDKREPALKLASFFFTLSLFLFILSFVLKGQFFWLLWPASSFFLISLGYISFGPNILQKYDNCNTLSACIVFLPYIVCAYLLYFYHRQKLKPFDQILPNLSIGYLPTQLPNDSIVVFDLTAEFCTKEFKNQKYSFPLLDLVPPSEDQISHIVNTLEKEIKERPVFIHCALGLSRSSIIVAAYLLKAGIAKDIDESIQIIQAKRNIKLGKYHINSLLEFQKRIQK